MTKDKKVAVLGLLQNPWFKPGTPYRFIRRYAEDQAFHRKVLELSRTGRYLRTAFGKTYDEIWWDNASPVHGYSRDHVSLYDLGHVAGLLDRIKPDIVIAFGRSAQAAMRYFPAYRVIETVHPMARGDAMPALRQAAEKLWHVTSILTSA